MAVRYDWKTIRADYESGVPVESLCRDFGMSRAVLLRRVKREGWQRAVSGVGEAVASVKSGAQPERHEASRDASGNPVKSGAQPERPLPSSPSRFLQPSQPSQSPQPSRSPRSSQFPQPSQPSRLPEAWSRPANEAEAVLRRHREVWAYIRELNVQALAERDTDAAKLAKLAAETERIIQEAERRAWGMQDRTESLSGGVTVTHTVSAEIAAMLARMRGGANEGV